MNNKGFTLVELLATIVIIGLVMGIASYGVISAINSSKKKSVELFSNEVDKLIHSYIAMNSDEFDDEGIQTSIRKCDGDECSDIDVEFIGDFMLSELVNSDLVSQDKFVNPISKKQCYNDSLNTKVNVYRDDSSVFYYEVNMNGVCDFDSSYGRLSNFTYMSCGNVGDTIDYAGKEWLVIGNDGSTCELALNSVSTSSGSYGSAKTKLFNEYFKGDDLLSTEYTLGHIIDYGSDYDTSKNFYKTSIGKSSFWVGPNLVYHSEPWYKYTLKTQSIYSGGIFSRDGLNLGSLRVPSNVYTTYSQTKIPANLETISSNSYPEPKSISSFKGSKKYILFRVMTFYNGMNALLVNVSGDFGNRDIFIPLGESLKIDAVSCKSNYNYLNSVSINPISPSSYRVTRQTSSGTLNQSLSVGNNAYIYFAADSYNYIEVPNQIIRLKCDSNYNEYKLNNVTHYYNYRLRIKVSY